MNQPDQFKPGQTVRIRTDLKLWEKYGKHSHIPHKHQYRGKSAKIVSVEDGSIILDIDTDWFWSAEMLEPIQPEQPQQVWKSVYDSYGWTLTDGKKSFWFEDVEEVEWLCNHLNTLTESLNLADAKVAKLQEQVDKLQQFKDYVHNRLDQIPITSNPDGEHSKAGCRIGDRLDIVQNIINTAKNQRSLLIKLNHLLSNDSEYNRIDLQKER